MSELDLLQPAPDGGDAGLNLGFSTELLPQFFKRGVGLPSHRLGERQQMFFVELGCCPSAARQWSKTASFPSLLEEFINVSFGDAEHFCNLFVSSELLTNGINNLLTQFYGICFHTPSGYQPEHSCENRYKAQFMPVYCISSLGGLGRLGGLGGLGGLSCGRRGTRRLNLRGLLSPGLTSV